jgi:uncharacterized protein (DUF934 family)
MPLLKDGAIADDVFVTLSDEDALPQDGAQAVIVSATRWAKDRALLLARSGALGVRVKPADNVETLAEDLPRLSVVALEFPKFNDGRAFSSARLLRERLGFTGEVRAVGDVLRDQLLFMQRCGFSSYDIPRTDAPDVWAAAMAEYTVFYQPMADGRPWANALRHGLWRHDARVPD